MRDPHLADALLGAAVGFLLGVLVTCVVWVAFD